MTGRNGKERQVGINLTWLVPGVVGGSEEYSVRLLEGLVEELPPDLAVRLYGRQDLFDTYPFLNSRYEAVPMPDQPRSRAKRVLMEQTWLADVSQNDRVVHHMGGTTPLRPPPPGQRQIVTVHDLQPIDMPANFGWTKRRWLGYMIPRSVRQADKVVCPSRFTAKRLRELLSAPASKIVVVHHGFEAPEPGADSDSAGICGADCDSADSDSADNPSAEVPTDRRPPNSTQVRLKDQRFVLYPAIAYKHKRHRDVVEALAMIATESATPQSAESVADSGASAMARDKLHVVFTGRRGPESDRIDQLISDLGLTERVHVLGRVPEEELDWLYRHAVAMVFPSEYEGFGNPCLEAMSRGCPVLAASAAALPEVVGEAGLLFPVGDIEAIANGIRVIVSEPETEAEMVSAGYIQAGRFTPDMATLQLWAVYRELLGAANDPNSARLPGAPPSESATPSTGETHRRP